MIPETVPATDRRAAFSFRGVSWVLALAPLFLLGGLVFTIVWSGPADVMHGGRFPPVEQLRFQGVILEPGGIVANVLNDGPDPVAIAQVQVDDAFWTFSADQGLTLGHLGRTTLRIPYPWVEGETHVLRVLTSTGLTFEHEIAVAVESPSPNLRSFGVFALIGLYVGVFPVAIGLAWFPFLSRLSSRGMDFLLALTVGLLAFLLIDGSQEGIESAGALPESFQGVVMFTLVAAGSYLVLEAFGDWLRSRRRDGVAAGAGGRVLALLSAVGIGLHNFGEGLAIGAAFALGEAALGTLLIVGFTLHNTTEGVAIVAPLARERLRVSLIDLVKLGLIGGLPTVGGAWLGGFVYSPVWSVVFLGLGVGAVAQVAVLIARQIAGGLPMTQQLVRTPVLMGLFMGFGVMYVTGMLIG